MVLVPAPSLLTLAIFVQSLGVNSIRAELELRLHLASRGWASYLAVQRSRLVRSVCSFNHQSIEDVWKSGGIAPRILNLGIYVEVPGKLTQKQRCKLVVGRCLGSNLVWGTNYRGRILWFTLVLRDKCRDSISIRSLPIPSKSFPVHSPNQSTLCNVDILKAS
jgi:hypothetical protein